MDRYKSNGMSGGSFIFSIRTPTIWRRLFASGDIQL